MCVCLSYCCVRYVFVLLSLLSFFFFKQKTAYEMRISDWSSDVCSSDLRASAISASGNGAFEPAVIQRVVFGPDGKALVVRIEARTSRHRPAFENAVQLEPQIVMQPGCVMLLDDKAVAACRPGRAGGFGRFREIALCPVCLKRFGAGHRRPASPNTK